MVFIQLRTKDVDVVDDRTGNGDDVGREGIEDGRGHDGHGEESRPNVNVRLRASLPSPGNTEIFEGYRTSTPSAFHRREPLLGRKS